MLSGITNHKPYIKSDQFRKEISDKQRLKGAAKYPKLFDPDDWSDEELVEHAMMEFQDGQEYVAGIRTRMQDMRSEIERQHSVIKSLVAENIELKRTRKKMERYL